MDEGVMLLLASMFLLFTLAICITVYELKTQERLVKVITSGVEPLIAECAIDGCTNERLLLLGTDRVKELQSIEELNE